MPCEDKKYKNLSRFGMLDMRGVSESPQIIMRFQYIISYVLIFCNNLDILSSIFSVDTRVDNNRRIVGSKKAIVLSYSKTIA